MEEITLQEYAERIHLTIEDIVRLAATKHIAIPPRPDFIINESTMRIITPIIVETRNHKDNRNTQDEEAIKKAEAYAEANMGQVFDGKVSKVLSHGAYIEFDGQTGFIFSSEIAWGFIGNAKSIIKEEDEFLVMVIGSRGGKVNLSKKRLEEDPLINYAPQAELGQAMEGVVRKVSKGTAYIEIHEGILGECTLSDEQRVVTGSKVSCTIENIDTENHRVELSIAEIIEEPQSIKPENKRNNYVGFMKFYSSERDFGYVIYCVPGMEAKGNNLKECRLNSSDWEGPSKPAKGDWIVFKAVKGNRGWIAKKARPLSFDKNGILSAMEYRMNNAYIKGIDEQGDRHHVNVLCHAIEKLKRTDNEWDNTLIQCFAEYLSLYGSDQVNTTIQEFLYDNEICKLLITLQPKLQNYASENEAYINAIAKLSQAVESKIFEDKSIDLLSALTSDFDYITFHKKVIETLEFSIENDSDKVESWLESHKHFVDTILITGGLVSIDLAYVVYRCSDNFAVMAKTGAAWGTIYAWLRKKPTKVALNYLLYLITDKDEAFIKQLDLPSVIDKTALAELTNKCLSSPSRYSVTLRVLATHYAAKDLKTIGSYIQYGIDITHTYQQLGILLNTSIITEEPTVRHFITTCTENNFSFDDIIKSVDSICDEMHIELFAQTGYIEHLNAIEDEKFKLVFPWLKKQQADFVLLFLQKCQRVFVDEEDKEAIADILRAIDSEVFKTAIAELTTDEQYKIIKLCPEDYANDLICRHFAMTPLWYLYIGEQWEKLKASIPYVTFDLESDGESIKEFAFRKKNDTKTYQGEEQLGTLLRALKQTQIIVGHRIKEWDLGKVLSKKGFKSDAFIWDTLEIEILLNPCRYSYALRTQHTAKEDTELADKLFWNQLFRLSQDDELCKELSSFLPDQIAEILNKLRQPMFADFFKQSSSENDGFYQVLVDTDKRIIEQLDEINNQEGETLIVAPKRLWSRISEHISLSFEQQQDGIDYSSLSLEKMEKQPIENTFINAVIRRFVNMSKTPIVANLARYIRLNYLDDTILADYTVPAVGSVKCADMDIIQKEAALSKYNNIYFVGCEIENRLNQYKLATEYSPADFWKKENTYSGASIPMRLGASSFLGISSEERERSIFKDVPADAANVWIERLRSGKYTINYNYDFYGKLKAIEERRDTNIEIHTIPWTIGSDNVSSVYLVHSENKGGFDAQSKRVSATSRYRAAYWVYQFALLSRIHTTVDSKPIILFLDDDLEKDEVEQYARECGFYIPSGETLIRRLELIEHHSNGLLVVSTEKFFEIVDWRKDVPYCYVWDHIAVDKHMMMWHGFADERNKSFLNDGIESNNKNLGIGGTTDTYQSIICSIWPVYEYYYRFIRANSVESTMYVLDSYFEEYHSIASEWGVSSYGISNLWPNEKAYNTAVGNARTNAFKKESESAVHQTDASIENAMDVIWHTLVESEKTKGKTWTAVQREVFPKIMEKKENYLVSLPTGGGKSVLFQGPALYNAAFTNKLSIVITPLKALMQDQVNELGERGFITNVDYLNGDRSQQETKSIYRKINGGEIAVLYVTPERFRSRSFLNALSTRMANDNGLEYLVFDEAHCVSQWGMEFRPEYLNVIKVCKELQETYDKMCVAMFSATVTDMVFNQINNVIPVVRLGQDNDKKIYNPIRSHIGMSFKEVLHDTQHRLAEVVNYIRDMHINPQKSRMLLFCKTRNQCEEMALLLADKLAEEGILNTNNAQQCVGYFHAGMDGGDREDMYDRFKDENDQLYILCATKAFGMGMDIPNIHYIVHLTPPSVLEDYLQEVGRAGRNEDMYKETGFSVENPIPTLCLCSKEDVKKAKEQLLQSSLSWKNLEEIRKAINDYILKIQSLEKTKDYPIVVPNTLWASSQYDHDFTNFKIGQYWLERMDRIKLGYLSPAHININLFDNESLDEKLRKLNNTNKGTCASEIVTELRHYSNKQNSSTIQVSIQELASTLSMPSTKLLDCLLRCEKHGILSIEQEARCRVAFKRLSEVQYMLNAIQKPELAFDIILNATRSLLKNNGLKKEKAYTMADIRRLVVQNSDNLQKQVKTVEKVDENGKAYAESYMIWYEETDKRQNKGLSLAKSYHDDLYKKRIRQVFALLEMIPGVKVQSYLDTKKKAVLQSVIVENNAWKEWLDSFQTNCLSVLRYVYAQRMSTIKWSETVTALNLQERGYVYFESILRYLNGMAYISCDPLLPMGVEVYTTEHSETEVLENTEGTSDNEAHKEFDEAAEIRNLRLCVMDVLTTKIKGKQEFQELISAYFSITDSKSFTTLLSKYYDDTDPIWESIRATAIKNAEAQLKRNPEQWAIYNENSNVNVNVEAGPGSGKTHVLTLKCAKLIYHQYVNPKSILVLAYNRAVVVELKERLAKLFASLGLSRSASQLHVYTFHSLAKVICGGKALEGREMKEWERILLETIKRNPNAVRAALPELQYVFIDEFQDITQTRLDAMFGLRSIFSPLTFFTIGDKDQSIYGFEKEESMDPNYYYNQLYEKLNPKKMTMTVNYRSWPKILTAAAGYLPATSKVPVPCKEKIETEPKHDNVYIYENQGEWTDDFPKYVMWLKQQGVNDLAVFFRTNNEVYHGYSVIKSFNLDGIRIRIQGASAAELFRMREVYEILRLLDKNAHERIKLEDGQTEKALKGQISSWISQFPNWDTFYFDFAFVLILDYLDFAESDEESHTYGDMSKSIKETLKEDNPQMYKLYDDKRFASRRILTDAKMTVVLTTMHKVKGLEFDAVMITPSVTSLPFNPIEDIPVDTPISDHDREMIEEEQRLLYVAYTRARMYLFVYKGQREYSVENFSRFSSREDQWGIRERKVGLENYNIGYNAGFNFNNNRYIALKVRKNDPVVVRRYRGINKHGQPFSTFNIVHNRSNIGQLSRRSGIARRMEIDNLDILSGFFVGDVFYWTYEDTINADLRAERENGFNPNFAAGWCEEAKKQGYIFIVDIAGYGI